MQWLLLPKSEKKENHARELGKKYEKARSWFQTNGTKFFEKMRKEIKEHKASIDINLLGERLRVPTIDIDMPSPPPDEQDLAPKRLRKKNLEIPESVNPLGDTLRVPTIDINVPSPTPDEQDLPRKRPRKKNL